MNKKFIGLFIGLIMLSTIPLAAGQQSIEENVLSKKDDQSTSIFGATVIAGYIMNPKYIGNRVTARALVLGYYDRGIIFKDSGIAVLRQVQFKEGSLLYMSEPNDYGLIMVVGICTGFDVGL